MTILSPRETTTLDIQQSGTSPNKGFSFSQPLSTGDHSTGTQHATLQGASQSSPTIHTGLWGREITTLVIIYSFYLWE